jgi:hypothetical protein
MTAGVASHRDESGPVPLPMAPPPFAAPPRATARVGIPFGPVERYLAALAASLEGQLDSALEATGILTPLGCVARAALLEQIGADIDAAVRDLMYSGVPRERAEALAVERFGPAPVLGRDLLASRRREALEAWQRQRDAVWWWTEPLLPVFAVCAAIFTAALAPALALVAGIAAQPLLGTLAVAFVPLVAGTIIGVCETMAADIDMRFAR